MSWLANAQPLSRLELRREREEARRYVEELRIQAASLTREVLFFSGGNQQKVILARWMSSGARILIFDEPTRGIDVGAKAEVFALMSRLVGDGASILMISSEMRGADRHGRSRSRHARRPHRRASCRATSSARKNCCATRA